MKSIRAFIFFIFSLSSQAITAQLCYYGVKSDALNGKNAELASNLFYEELKKISTNVSDMRGKNAESSNDAFYVEINKIGKESLRCTFVFLQGGKQKTKTREYDSFYQMLVEPKDYLEAVFKDMQKAENDFPPTANGNYSVLTHESVQGEWRAEEGISKVILMRGNRGFIIFNNGASMRVSSSIEGSSLIIKQSGTSNASYFPTLPREAALKGALSAAAVEWRLVMNAKGRLSGTKKTLLVNEKGEPYMGEVNVEWRR